jgi:hypothetical protein
MRKINQLSLFGFPDTPEKAKAKRGRTQHEKAFMKDIMDAAQKLNLPCTHIDYFCGNKFYVRCDCGEIAICRKCGKKVLAKCNNVINKGLHHLPDIIGIAWTIETKHKTTKKKQTPKASEGQEKVLESLHIIGVPALVVNEDNSEEALKFLTTIRDKQNAN